ncbi:MAG: TonB-dependent receptor [Chitinophagaceae bacterium]|nr:TonB-dependent receptor [Chitinophagaceae bacterium]
MKKIVIAILSLVTLNFSQAQMTGSTPRAPRNMNGGSMNVGRFYGKIVDKQTDKGIENVTIQLIGNKYDSATKKMKESILRTVFTESNGDFNLEDLPIFGNFKFVATAIGYKKIEKKITFGISLPSGNSDGNAMQQMMALADKDLGNYDMTPDESYLQDVTVSTSTKQQFELGIDRKIFNVDKSLVSAGQTAVELMKTIPSLNVDIDGNVSLRNAAPTIFVDGRPTTLQLDQIPVDIIDKVEIITNPSAKFDASGGNAGILNIILKKNQKNGYNGNLRSGIDSRARVNIGGDINLRQNKVNVFLSGNYNQRKSISTNLANTNLFTNPDTLINSGENQTNLGYFAFIRGGMDFLIDNRNTLTFNGNFNRGNFKTEALQNIDSSNAAKYSYSNRNSMSEFNFRNLGTQLSFKHNFPQTGHNLGADINYNLSKNTRVSDIGTQTFLPNGTPKNNQFLQRTDGAGTNEFFTFQSDYERKYKNDTKFEAGIRAAIRNFETENFTYIDGTGAGNYTLNNRASNKYQYTDKVYAAYTTYSFKTETTNFQLGLRAESSDYFGQLKTLAGADSTSFSIKYPISLFPSVFITKRLQNKQDLQINYSRRVNRPNFFQLLPSYDFTDPQNPSVGNPNLNPEFTHSFEFSYNNQYGKGSNFLATTYFKYSDNLITRYVYKDINRNYKDATDSLFYGSYINANNSYTYGLELTNRMAVTKWWDLMLNFNLYNTQINAVIPNQIINNSLVSWNSKVNSTFKLSKGLNLQINWDARSKTIIPQGGGGGRGGFGGNQTLAQGFTLPRYFDIDVSLRKEWTWKNGRVFSANLSINDIFATHVYTETNAIYFNQNTDRLRDPQVLRFNISYRFGKQDFSLFKRKNTKAEQGGGMEMIPQ